MQIPPLEMFAAGKTDDASFNYFDFNGEDARPITLLMQATTPMGVRELSKYIDRDRRFVADLLLEAAFAHRPTGAGQWRPAPGCQAYFKFDSSKGYLISPLGLKELAKYLRFRLSRPKGIQRSETQKQPLTQEWLKLIPKRPDFRQELKNKPIVNFALIGPMMAYLHAHDKLHEVLQSTLDAPSGPIPLGDVQGVLGVSVSKSWDHTNWSTFLAKYVNGANPQKKTPRPGYEDWFVMGTSTITGVKPHGLAELAFEWDAYRLSKLDPSHPNLPLTRPSPATNNENAYRGEFIDFEAQALPSPAPQTASQPPAEPTPEPTPEQEYEALQEKREKERLAVKPQSHYPTKEEQERMFADLAFKKKTEAAMKQDLTPEQAAEVAQVREAYLAEMEEKERNYKP